MSMNCEVYRVPAATIERLVGESSGLIEILSDLDGPEDALSLEKSWHGLHFVLTGSAAESDPPLNFLVAGGQPLGGGEERLISATDVQLIAAELTKISEQEFAARFDLATLDAADVYPRIWDEPLDDLLDEYFDYFQELKSLVQRAADSNSGLLVAMG
jgi:hypothetical protein